MQALARLHIVVSRPGEKLTWWTDGLVAAQKLVCVNGKLIVECAEEGFRKDSRGEGSASVSVMSAICSVRCVYAQCEVAQVVGERRSLWVCGGAGHDEVRRTRGSGGCRLQRKGSSLCNGTQSMD
jgi:hypothetical protein